MTRHATAQARKPTAGRAARLAADFGAHFLRNAAGVLHHLHSRRADASGCAQARRPARDLTFGLPTRSKP